MKKFKKNLIKKSNMHTLFLSMILLLISSCTQKGQDSIYILPKDYTGYVIIFFNQPNGASEQVYNNKRIYNIPKSGVLKTKFSPEYLQTHLPEFYYNEVNKKYQLPLVVDWKDYKKETINISMPSMGKTYKKIDGSEAIEYEIFFVGTKDQVQKYSEEFNKIDIVELLNKH